jgi:PAS domain S-box-containing protein
MSIKLAFPDLPQNDSLFENSFFQTILATINDGILVTETNYIEKSGPKIIFVNAAFCRMTGYSAHEVIGKNPRFLQGPKTSRLQLEKLKEGLKNKASVRVNLIIYRKDESEFDVELDIVPIYNKDNICTHFVSIQREDSKRRKKEKTLKASNSFNKTIIESSPDCLKILNKNGEIIFINQNGLCLLELEDSNLILNSAWSDFWDEEQKEVVQDALKDALQGKESKFLAPCKTFKGNQKWWSVLVRPILNSKGKVIQILTVSRDITNERIIEEKISVLNENIENNIEVRTKELKKKNQELENANVELASFNYMASHDLQEPLRKIQMFSNMILDTDEKLESVERNLPKILAASDRMRNLITDLHNFSAVKSNELKLEPVNINTILEEVMFNLSEQIAENSASISTNKLPVISGIDLLLVQLFSNLIENSLKYRKQDVSPIITIKSEEADVVDAKESYNTDTTKFYKIIYTDNGIGFDNSQKEKIFKLFQRLHQKNQYSGTGIGLTICKTIMQKHGGWIEAEGVAGVSGTFIMYFPKR